MPSDEQFRRLLDLLRLPAQLLLGPAPLLRTVGRDLTAVHRKHLLSDQSFCVTDSENVAVPGHWFLPESISRILLQILKRRCFFYSLNAKLRTRSAAEEHSVGFI